MFDPNCLVEPQDLRRRRRNQEKKRHIKSSYLQKVGKPCAGLVEEVSAVARTRRSVVDTCKTECHPSSPLPGHRWYGCASRMTFPGSAESPKEATAEAEDVSEKKEAGNLSESQSEGDEPQGADLSGGSLDQTRDEKTTELEDEDEDLDDYDDDDEDEDEETDLLHKKGDDSTALDVGEDAGDGPLPGPAGIATGAVLGFGIGMTIALPFWYFLSSGDSLCSRSSWKYRY